MAHKPPKTEGIIWLKHSLMAFNGAGYANMNSPEEYLESYVTYKKMRKDGKALGLVEQFGSVLLADIEDLLDHTPGASRTPAPKAMKRFEQFKDQQKLI